MTVPSTATVKYRAWDNTGNVEAVNTQVVQIDHVAPATAIACDGATCSNGWSKSAVTVSLDASDDGGAGLASVHYTTDGSTPTPASPLYTAPFAVSSTKTVKFRAWDTAGNTEATKSQTIAIDRVAPTATMKCKKAACPNTWSRGNVKVTLSATDTGGSGVASIHYTTNGSRPTEASPLYSGPFTLKATKTVKFAAFDRAGNRSAVRSKRVKIDRTKPIVATTAPKKNATVRGTVRVTAKVRDAQSKVAKVLFYIDGRLVATDTTPAFSFVWNTRTASKRRHTVTARAVDKAGNRAAQSITVTVG